MGSFSRSLPFMAAALLAGGQSKRMGTPKAELEIEGQPLWQWQLRKLTSLPVDGGVFICAKENQPWKLPDEVAFIYDTYPGWGPLAALYSLMQQIHAQFYLLLAVDIPNMSAGWLQDLCERTQKTQTGIIAKDAEFYQPLAATYPREAMPIIEEFINGEDQSMHRLVKKLLHANLMQTKTLTDAETPLFENWNHPPR